MIISNATGIGLRREWMQDLLNNQGAIQRLDFLECVPENWLGITGAMGDVFSEIANQYPMVAHSLSLSLGGHEPFSSEYLQDIKSFLERYQIHCYSAHLSYASDAGNLYDLIPMPFNRAAVAHISQRIQTVQQFLGRKLAVENISYYMTLDDELSELDFIRNVLDASACDLLLDVNNVYVNARNHHYDAENFIRQLADCSVAYIHVAGHQQLADGMLFDHHGAAVCDEVYHLLQVAYEVFGAVPTMIERDNHLPTLNTMLDECGRVRSMQARKIHAV